jgi:hypothetical protein
MRTRYTDVHMPDTYHESPSAEGGGLLGREMVVGKQEVIRVLRTEGISAFRAKEDDCKAVCAICLSLLVCTGISGNVGEKRKVQHRRTKMRARETIGFRILTALVGFCGHLPKVPVALGGPWVSLGSPDSHWG